MFLDPRPFSPLQAINNMDSYILLQTGTQFSDLVTGVCQECEGSVYMDKLQLLD